MTSIYYAIGDTEEKYGWDLDSPQAPPVPRCVSRKYRVTWERASPQTKKSRVADYAEFMMEKDEEKATERGAPGILAGILSTVFYQKADGKCDARDNRSLINAVKDKIMDELNQLLKEKLEIVHDLDEKIDGIAEEIDVVAEDALFFSTKVEDLEAKVDEVVETKEGSSAKQSADPIHNDPELLSSNEPTHAINQPQLDMEGNNNEVEEYVELQWQFLPQSQSQYTYHTCRCTPSQKPENGLDDKLDDDEFEKPKPKPKAWDHGWESE